MSKTEIDIFEGLKAQKRQIRNRKTGQFATNQTKFFIEFQLPDLGVVLDNKEIAKTFAQAMTLQIRQNADKGLDPNGVPLPAASPSTMKRRRYRAEQSKREGSLSPRIKDKELRKKGRRNFFKRFGAKLSSGVDYPDKAPIKGRAGYESGLMLKTLAVGPIGEESYGIFFKNNRAIQRDKHGSAVLRVFGPSGSLRPFSARGLEQPFAKQALKALARDTLRAGDRKAIKGFVDALKQTAQSSLDLALEAADTNA